MKKIISLFQRNYDGNHLVRDEIVPGAEWVVNGEGIATRKYDGTCCMVREGILYKRYDLKEGRKAPALFEPSQERDPVTSHMPGWIPVGKGNEDRWHVEAFVENSTAFPDGTYELCGPKVQGNPEHFDRHILIPHGAVQLTGVPTDYKTLQYYFIANDMEGVVWHHEDGRMVKIKARDFGLTRVGRF